MLKYRHMIITAIFLLILTAVPIMAAEKGSADFDIGSAVRVAGVDIDEGRYKVAWKANGDDSTEADVTFTLSGKNDEINVKGKIVRTEKKDPYTLIIFGKDSSGQKVIKQLQFSGKKIRIAFE